MNGANINSKTKENVTPLETAIASGNTEIALELLAKNAKIFTCHLEYSGVIHFLVIQYLETINQPSSSNYGPALENFTKKIVEEFKIILENCIKKYSRNVDEMSDKGKTCLHYCCISEPFSHLISYSSKIIIKCLLEFGANINAQDHAGYTPLMYAVKYQLYEETAVLIKYGADPYIENEDGTSALVLAQGCGDQTQLFLNTLRKASSIHGEEKNQIVQCQMHLNQVCRVLSKQKNMVEDSKQKEILASLRHAVENLQLLTKDPKVNKELQIQNDVLNDNRQKICQALSPEYVYDKLRQDG